MEMNLDEWELVPDTKGRLEIGRGEPKEAPFLEIVGSEREKLPLSECKDIDVVEEKERSVPSQVFFKGIDKDAPVADHVKMDSPDFGARLFVPQPEPFSYSAREEEEEEDTDETEQKPPAHKAAKAEESEKISMESVHNKEKPCWCIDFSFWKWRVSGIGVLLSGVAAATICIFIIGSKQGQKNQKSQFRIYAEEKQRIKQVVQQASMLNHAMSAVRGESSMARANISFGGYYEGL